jgi:uncharacterized paraquat-inducible protein A
VQIQTHDDKTESSGIEAPQYSAMDAASTLTVVLALRTCQAVVPLPLATRLDRENEQRVMISEAAATCLKARRCRMAASSRCPRVRAGGSAIRSDPRSLQTLL